ncbi:MAG: nucleotidyltransferase domain-containing protein [Lachnospiraceae bacterium]|nr:nucleotidyltransferase domain-containing protein [Lachnospiraceae bacterium]
MCQLISIGNGKAVANIKHRHIVNISEQARTCKNISRIMLFGSSLEERCTEKSDIDIAVFGKMKKGKYLDSKEFRKFMDQLFRFDLKQDYDILYFCDGQRYDDAIMADINRGAEIYRRIEA